MKAKHTPMPWWLDDDGNIASGFGVSYITIADPRCSKAIDPQEIDANAEFIIRAVNSHEELLETLKYCLGVFQLRGSGQESPKSNSEMCDLIGGVVAKAEGVQS